MLKIELFSHLIVWEQKTVLMLNWIVWNRTTFTFKNDYISTKGWDCPNECAVYDTKESDGKSLVMHWGM